MIHGLKGETVPQCQDGAEMRQSECIKNVPTRSKDVEDKVDMRPNAVVILAMIFHIRSCLLKGACEKNKRTWGRIFYHPWQETVHNDHVPLSAQIKVV